MTFNRAPSLLENRPLITDTTEYIPIMITVVHTYMKIDKLTVLDRIGTSVSVAVSRCSSGRLAMTLVDRYFHHSFLFFLHFSFFSVVYIFHRRNALIKNLVEQKLFRTPKNLGLDHFPDPDCHFGAPWWPFLVLQAVRRCRR